MTSLRLGGRKIAIVVSVNLQTGEVSDLLMGFTVEMIRSGNGSCNITISRDLRFIHRVQIALCII